jgi:hypothetical protein
METKQTQYRDGGDYELDAHTNTRQHSTAKRVIGIFFGFGL